MLEIPRLRVAGNAPVFLHWSLLILVAFFGFISWQFSVFGASWNERMAVALISPIFFVCTIFLHELAHALVSYKVYKVWVTGIYLYALGGLTVTSVDGAANAQKSMMVLVAVAGPLVNGVIGAILLGSYYIFKPADLLLAFLLLFHGWFQIALLVYNMLPGVPLDGSNVLVGLIRYCTTDGKARVVGYGVGVAVLIVAVVLTCIFLSISSGIFLIMTLMYTAFAFYDAYQKEKPPQSLTNPTY